MASATSVISATGASGVFSTDAAAGAQQHPSAGEPGQASAAGEASGAFESAFEAALARAADRHEAGTQAASAWALPAPVFQQEDAAPAAGPGRTAAAPDEDPTEEDDGAPVEVPAVPVFVAPTPVAAAPAAPPEIDPAAADANEDAEEDGRPAMADDVESSSSHAGSTAPQADVRARVARPEARASAIRTTSPADGTRVNAPAPSQAANTAAAASDTGATSLPESTAQDSWLKEGSAEPAPESSWEEPAIERGNRRAVAGAPVSADAPEGRRAEARHAEARHAEVRGPRTPAADVLPQPQAQPSDSEDTSEWAAPAPAPASAVAPASTPGVETAAPESAETGAQATRASHAAALEPAPLRHQRGAVPLDLKAESPAAAVVTEGDVPAGPIAGEATTEPQGDVAIAAHAAAGESPATGAASRKARSGRSPEPHPADASAAPRIASRPERDSNASPVGETERGSSAPVPPAETAGLVGQQVRELFLASRLPDEDGGAERFPGSEESPDEAGTSESSARLEETGRAAARAPEPAKPAAAALDLNPPTTLVTGLGSSSAPGRIADFEAVIRSFTAGGTADLPAADTPDRIVQSLRMQFQRGGGDAIVQIRPEHLGPLTVSLRVENGAVQARVTTENPAVAEWLQANQETLRESLKSSGLDLDRLVINRDPDPTDRESPRDLPQPRRDRRRFADHRQSTFEIRV